MVLPKLRLRFDCLYNITYILNGNVLSIETGGKGQISTKSIKIYWWPLIFIIFGLIGLAVVSSARYAENKEMASYRQQYSDDAAEYLAMYDKWRQLDTNEQQEFSWNQGEHSQKTRGQLAAEQQARLKADMAELAAGTKQPQAVSDILYGSDWRQEVQKYQTKRDLLSAVAIGSTVSMMTGLVVICLWFGWSGVGRIIKKYGQRKAKEQVVQEQIDEPDDEEEPVADAGDIIAEILKTDSAGGVPMGRSDYMLMTDKSTEAEYKGSTKADEPTDKPFQRLGQRKGEKLPEQFTKLMSTEPMANSLTELTQEVSAIRQFTAMQQDRVRQLQDGYDWSIIKRFCMRIIRCIDNLDDRIGRSSGSDEQVQCLEDVRDELIFALESSGVECFEPHIDSNYKGQESRAEAIKDRHATDDDALKGRIASVIRSGYQYIVSDTQIKVVRSAQVKLYG